MHTPRPCILLIDDDEGFGRLVTKHLERRGFDAITSQSSSAALERLRQGAVDAVILDHVMPGDDGLSVLQAIRALPDAPPVVYLTGTQDSRVAVAALKAGAADYVVKDLQGEFLDLLETAVMSALGGAEVRRARDAAEAEVRRARDQFKALAEERALLMREVNHRVSNSLQLIASLLHFQADISDSSAVKDALKEANGRVMAVARVHRWLYISEDVRAVSLNEYLHTLIDDLESVTGGSGQQSPIAIETEALQVDPDKAVAVGIIATELILNAFKHAYPDATGPVRVYLRRSNSGRHGELVVEDDGIGTVNGNPRPIKLGLGQRIIRGMADKLAGELAYDKSWAGTRAILTFPLHCETALREDIHAS
jgi:two-component sensor histidine kinase